MIVDGIPHVDNSKWNYKKKTLALSIFLNYMYNYTSLGHLKSIGLEYIQTESFHN